MRNLLLIMAVAIMSSSTAFASFVFNPSVSHFSREASENGTSVDTTFTYVDAKFGYLAKDIGLYFGLLYSLVDEDTGVLSASNFYAGPTVGYTYKGASIMATYIAVGESDLSSGGVKYSGATGLQLDLGYTIPVTENFSIGPMLSYRSVEFREQETQGIAIDTDRKESGLTPYVSMWFTFL